MKCRSIILSLIFCISLYYNNISYLIFIFRMQQWMHWTEPHKGILQIWGQWKPLIHWCIMWCWLLLLSCNIRFQVFWSYYSLALIWHPFWLRLSLRSLNIIFLTIRLIFLPKYVQRLLFSTNINRGNSLLLFFWNLCFPRFLCIFY